MKKRNKSNYRKIYEQHHGSIPKDEFGRSYDIHHIDGDPSNDDIDNLIALTILDHYNIHHSRGDWGACMKLKARMALSVEELSKLTSSHNKKQWELLGNNHPAALKSREMMEDGTHPFLVSNKIRLEDGTHNWIQSWSCQFCGKSGKNMSLFTRWGHSDGSCLGKRDFLPHNTDHKIYHWKNKITGESAVMTRTELSRKYDLNHRDIYMVVSKRRKTTKGWSLVSV